MIHAQQYDQLYKQLNDASGALAGLGEAELRKKLHERTQGILAEIREELEKV